MALNIRNERAEELAKSVVQLTGETKTQAVTKALQERLDRLRAKNKKRSLVEDVLEIARQCDKLPELDNRSAEEILGYDEDGLPT
ncbi:MAG: type II toxin-antitoxin system VapB family antitoxin [Gammaproteobacteria bacterium]|nr:type II toxin-antitoxin system VapB family antitoxin [Gammaproteobacteria bacterium]